MRVDEAGQDGEPAKVQDLRAVRDPLIGLCDGRHPPVVDQNGPLPDEPAGSDVQQVAAADRDRGRWHRRRWYGADTWHVRGRA